MAVKVVIDPFKLFLAQTPAIISNLCLLQIYIFCRYTLPGLVYEGQFGHRSTDSSSHTSPRKPYISYVNVLLENLKRLVSLPTYFLVNYYIIILQNSINNNAAQEPSFGERLY